MHSGGIFSCICCKNYDSDLIVSMQELEHAKIYRKLENSPCYMLKVSVYCGKCAHSSYMLIPIERVLIED